jgi:UDP-N-acetylglucosamine:LPS N-acetylglucosamine transferase
MKILLVASVGGHLTQAMKMEAALRKHRVVLVVNEKVSLPDFPFEGVYQIAHAERDWRVLWNFVECAAILAAERPELIFSPGAGPAVPMFLLGRYLLGARTVYLECASAVTEPTLTGRLVKGLADDFFYQWESLAPHYPRGRLAKVLFR